MKPSRFGIFTRGRDRASIVLLGGIRWFFSRMNAVEASKVTSERYGWEECCEVLPLTFLLPRMWVQETARARARPGLKDLLDELGRH